jgi:WD40 repeat protein/DNA-binding SARP family transcriptional activator/energy-coupling factor transporter ATP-binding protein EcfA2
MEFRILGPLEVDGARGIVPLGGTKPRAVLAVLLLHANEPVSAERLALALWGEDAPPGAIKTVRVHVSRLRRALGDADLVTTSAAGYCLRVRPDELDAERFARLVDDARRALAGGHPEHAAAGLREALALWRGPPLADLAFEHFAAAEIARLEEQRLTALEARMEADLALGQHAEVVGELQQIAAEHPHRERLMGQLMLALYRCGRQADALEVYGDARRVLVAELGVEPGPELRRLHEAILRQDRSLESQVELAQPAELPPELDASTAPPLVGRKDELAWLRLRWGRAREGAGGVVTLAGVSGSGKLRLAAELAAIVHGEGDDVLYASGSGPADAFRTAVRRTHQATRPTLLVIHAVVRADAESLAELDVLSQGMEDRSVLVLACGEDVEALADLPSECVVMLEPLDAAAVGAIAHQYAPGTAGEEVPADWLLEASGGIPRVVHEVASQWARREAARKVGAVAGRAAAGREELRSIEAELTGDVEDLQEVRRRITPRRWEAPLVCPFKGLASFDIADAPYFYGREKLVAELVARLVGVQLLGIVGPSGSGKSSVMRAGLLPALAGGVLPGSDTWKQVLIRPGEHPLRELTDAMGTAAAGERVVLAVDQFEETFTTCEDEAERAAFIAELVREADERRGRCVVVIALRADFYGRCAAYAELAGLLASNHVLVRSMQRDELRHAIELPARRVGLRVDTELADALVADVKDEPGALPLLSTALLELWQRRDGRRLRFTVYEQTGGVRGAVARMAEDAFDQLDGEQQVVARGVLMRLAGEGAAGGVERRRVSLAELETDSNEDVARVVALLTDRRLLTASAGTIELAHEALMREWPRLRDWIDADREGLRIHRGLNAAAREWDELGRDDGALYRGARLTEAAEWNAAQQPRLNESERAFMEASEARRVLEGRQRRRRIALGFGSLTVALLAISVVAIVSVSQRREAQRQRDIAASRELAARSAGLLDSDPGLSRLVALAAYKRHDTEEAESAVRQATLADRAIAILPADAGEVYAATPSADGRLVATAGQDGSVRIWDLGRRRVTSTIKGHRGPAKAAGFSPDATKIATAGEDGDVALADVNGRHRHVLLSIPSGSEVHPTYPSSVEFSPRGDRLLVGARDGTVRLIDLRDGRPRVLGRHEQGVRMARFDRTGTKVVSAGFDGVARIWDVASGRSLALVHGNTLVIDASFSPDGRRVATASTDGSLRIWDARSGRAAVKPVKVVPQDLLSVRYSRDGRRLVTGAADGVVRVHDARNVVLLAELKGHLGYVYDAAFAAGGVMVSGGEDGMLRIWAPVRATALRADATDPKFSADGQRVLSGDYQGHVHVWNLATGADRRLPGHGDEQSVVRESADGSKIVSASADGTVRLYDVKSGRSRLVPAHATRKNAVAIDRTGRRIAFDDGPLIELRTDGDRRRVLRGHTDDVYSLDFSPDGKHLASASKDETARIFNVETGRRERTLRGHGDAVLSVSYDHDGRRVLTAGTDSTIRIWPVGGGDPTVLYGHRGVVRTAVFNRDGDRVVSAGEDGTVRVWDAADGQLLVVLQRHELANGADVSRDGRVVSAGGEGPSNSGVLRVSACAVCGPFADVLRLARSRADRTVNAAERRLLADGP